MTTSFKTSTSIYPRPSPPNSPNFKQTAPNYPILTPLTSFPRLQPYLHNSANSAPLICLIRPNSPPLGIYSINCTLCNKTIKPVPAFPPFPAFPASWISHHSPQFHPNLHTISHISHISSTFSPLFHHISPILPKFTHTPPYLPTYATLPTPHRTMTFLLKSHG
jgi:hypothetical protein